MITLSFVLLAQPKKPNPNTIKAAWAELFPDAGPLQASRSDEILSLEHGGVTTMVNLIDVPVPNGEAEGAARFSLAALGAAEPMAPHRAHFMVTSLSETVKGAELLRAHTHLVAALAEAEQALGVYEGNAHATHPRDFYVDVVRNTTWPTMVWCGLSLVRTPTHVELLTLGLEQLELPNLLLVAPPKQGNDALEFVFDLAAYIIDRGAPIAEGETVDRTAKEKLPVKYVASPIDQTSQVARVELK